MGENILSLVNKNYTLDTNFPVLVLSLPLSVQTVSPHSPLPSCLQFGRPLNKQEKVGGELPSKVGLSV